VCLGRSVVPPLRQSHQISPRVAIYGEYAFPVCSRTRQSSSQWYRRVANAAVVVVVEKLLFVFRLSVLAPPTQELHRWDINLLSLAKQQIPSHVTLVRQPRLRKLRTLQCAFCGKAQADLTLLNRLRPIQPTSSPHSTDRVDIVTLARPHYKAEQVGSFSSTETTTLLAAFPGEAIGS
jgi:hypothetical protein